TGEQLWVNRFGSPGVDERIKAMSISTNGDVFVTGTANTIKYFSSGLLAWTAPYAASDIKADTNGNAYVTGFRTDAYSTAKLDENGSNVWVRLWDKGPWDDVSQKIALDKVGNVFVLGLATFNCDMFGCYFQPW